MSTQTGRIGLYVLRRTDHRGGYLIRRGDGKTYTPDIRKAATFILRESAERIRKPDEVIVAIYPEAERRPL